jgi:hypothetical protein
LNILITLLLLPMIAIGQQIESNDNSDEPTVKPTSLEIETKISLENSEINQTTTQQNNKDQKDVEFEKSNYETYDKPLMMYADM